MILVLKIFLLFLGVHEILYWVYFLQLKEYRFDRLRSALWEQGTFKKTLCNPFDLRHWFRPKPTIRAIVIGLLPAVFFLAPFFYNAVVFLLTFLLLPLLIALSWIVSTPLFLFGKKMIIRQAKKKMENYPGTVIGITGSFGKTSTKEFLFTVLSSRFTVVKTEANNNSEIGVAKTIVQKLKGDEDIFIVEMGAYRRGEIKAICEIVHPKIGIITGISDQHLDLFGSLENIKKAKYELIESLPKDGYALIADKNFSLAEAKNINVTKERVEFVYKKVKFVVPIIGQEIIRNVICAIKVGEYLGLDLSAISTRLESLHPDLIYPKLHKTKNGNFVLDNSYNANVEGALALIKYLTVWKGWRKILITSAFIELGHQAKHDHELLGKELGIFDKVYLSSEQYFPQLNKFRNVEKIKDAPALINKIRQNIKSKTLWMVLNRPFSGVIDYLLSNV